MAQTLTVQQRNALFAQATRQNIQGLTRKSVKQGGSTLTFEIPKARLLSKVWLEIDAKLKVKKGTSQTTEIATDKLTPYQMIRRLSIDLNNG